MRTVRGYIRMGLLAADGLLRLQAGFRRVEPLASVLGTEGILAALLGREGRAVGAASVTPHHEVGDDRVVHEAYNCLEGTRDAHSVPGLDRGSSAVILENIGKTFGGLSVRRRRERDTELEHLLRFLSDLRALGFHVGLARRLPRLPRMEDTFAPGGHTRASRRTAAPRASLHGQKRRPEPSTEIASPCRRERYHRASHRVAVKS